METRSEQHDARISAEQDAKNDVSKVFWFFVGCILNFIGIFIAYAYQPTVGVKRIFGKSQMYTLFYERIYKSDRRKIQVKCAVIGAIIEFPIVIIALLFEYIFM